MILGYSLCATDTKKAMYGHKFIHLPKDTPACTKLKGIYDINYLPENYKLPRNSKSDFFETIDGFLIVSENARKFVKTRRYKNLDFVDLPGNPGFYWMKTHNIVEFDAKTAKTRFLGYVKACDAYKEVIGMTPVYLKSKKPLADGFFRTDLSFGGFGGELAKSPNFLVGSVTRDKIMQSGLRGVYFDAIRDVYPG